MTDKSEFSLIGYSSNVNYNHKTIVLDSNIVILLEKFFFTPNRMKNNEKELITKFLLNSLFKDKIPGFGIQEACSDRNTNTIDNEAKEKMLYAIETINLWGPDQIINHSLRSGGFEYKRTKREKPIMKLSLIDTIEELNPFLLPIYAAVLKIHLLNRKKSKIQNKLALLEEYVDFMNNEIKAILPIELHLAFDYFLGDSNKSNYVQNLLKFNPKKGSTVLDSVWNASWDIFFLRLLHWGSLNGLKGIVNPPMENPKLVTNDNDLIALAGYIEMTGGISRDGEAPNMTLIQMNLENLEKTVEYDRLDAIHEKILISQKIRIITSDYNSRKELKDVIINLEKQIMN